MSDFTPIIGMEIHVELKTASKMFCGCKNDPFHAPKPNIYTCPVCLGLPGALPVPNKKAVEWTILLGLALGCDVSLFSKFDRKHYFYPDLPKGYQISQYDQPLATNGAIVISSKFEKFHKEELGKKDPSARPSDLVGMTPEKKIRIRRVHLEEDTGKLQHAKVNDRNVTLVDFNRSGVPLVEIVTEPDIRSGEEAKAFLRTLHRIVKYLDISDADMEKGSMRMEPNLSIKVEKREKGKEKSENEGFIHEKELPGYKVEVKNINSFNFVKKAIEYEIDRHIHILQKGETPDQETRGWNENKGITFSQRKKEEAHDYRYFPDPDIPPMRFTHEYVESLRNTLPELPGEKESRFINSFGLSGQSASILTESITLADFYEAVTIQGAKKALKPKTIADWIINKKIEPGSIDPEKLAQTISSATTVKDVPDEEILSVVEEVKKVHAKAVSDYESGKEQAFMFLLGMTIKGLKGRGDKERVKELLKKSLE